jgi:hypothetical protein
MKDLGLDNLQITEIYFRTDLKTGKSTISVKAGLVIWE